MDFKRTSLESNTTFAPHKYHKDMCSSEDEEAMSIDSIDDLECHHNSVQTSKYHCSKEMNPPTALFFTNMSLDEKLELLNRSCNRITFTNENTKYVASDSDSRYSGSSSKNESDLDYAGNAEINVSEYGWLAGTNSNKTKSNSSISPYSTGYDIEAKVFQNYSFQQALSIQCNDDEDPNIFSDLCNDFSSDFHISNRKVPKTYLNGTATGLYVELFFCASFDPKGKLYLIPNSKNTSELIEGVAYDCFYLGSAQFSNSDGVNNNIFEDALKRVKCPPNERQPSVKLQIFVSTQKIVFLDSTAQGKHRILLDIPLENVTQAVELNRSLVLITKRETIVTSLETEPQSAISIIAHVFRSFNSALIASAIGQAFENARNEIYLERKSEVHVQSNDHCIDQAIDNTDEHSITEDQREIFIPKIKGERLGVDVTDSGWGSILPTVVVSAIDTSGPIGRSGLINVGDQLVSVNGISLIGMPTKISYSVLKSVRNKTSARFIIMKCSPVLNICMKKPTKRYQLGFSVHNGIICSLLRGGAAEKSGIRIGHRIIEINGESVVNMNHKQITDRIVNSCGLLKMKTTSVQMFNYLTGQTIPSYI